MTHDIYMAPDRFDGTLTLQASAGAWRGLATAIEQHVAIVSIRDRGDWQARAATIRASVVDDDPAVRITLPADEARAILRMAGVSA